MDATTITRIGNGREFLTVDEIAAKLGLSRKTVCNYAGHPVYRKNLPPFVKLGGKRNGRLRFPLDRYHQWKGSL